ncbi:hypothetical protein ACT8ZV_22270 [Nocardioides sp. MAHUQ-72]|uniref:hypothetical protein n=1 Tax=unclassified Nocardioides TaxID=2615069 RepID=UPI00361D50C3
MLVPGVLALLPEYAGLTDPVAELRAACLAAVGSLTGEVEVVASAQGRRVAEHLLEVSGPRAGGETSYLVVGNGSAMRTEKAPGHLDERAAAFDEALDKALRTPDPAALADLDEDLGAQLWADVTALRALGGLLTDAHGTTVDYADDPFGVQYWVMRWRCDS